MLLEFWETCNSTSVVHLSLVMSDRTIQSEFLVSIYLRRLNAEFQFVIHLVGRVKPVLRVFIGISNLIDGNISGPLGSNSKRKCGTILFLLECIS